MRPNAPPRGWLATAALVAALSVPLSIRADELDLIQNTSGTVEGLTGGTAIFARDHSHPTGTGVFDPFLTIKAPGNSTTEEGYNTGAFNLPMDDLRHHWNTDLVLGDLEAVTVGDDSYYLFELDANEQGQGNRNRLLTVGNIRIYTSGEGSQNPDSPEALDDSVLRWAMNEMGDQENTVLIDSSLGPTQGSGDSDLFVYIPASAFDGAADTDFVYFYNQNGVDNGRVRGNGSTAGFEEWRALAGKATVPDGGTTMLLLGIAIAGLSAAKKRFSK